jgi:hypothetical protein
MRVILKGVHARSLEAIEGPPREWRQKTGPEGLKGAFTLDDSLTAPRPFKLSIKPGADGCASERRQVVVLARLA